MWAVYSARVLPALSAAEWAQHAALASLLALATWLTWCDSGRAGVGRSAPAAGCPA